MSTIRSAISMILLFASLASYGQTSNRKLPPVMTRENYFDSAGPVFVKLYKKKDSTFLYWEIWNVDDKNATAHWGQLGDFGTQEKISGSSHLDFKDKVNSLLSNKISEGYVEIP